MGIDSSRGPPKSSEPIAREFDWTSKDRLITSVSLQSAYRR